MSNIGGGGGSKSSSSRELPERSARSGNMGSSASTKPSSKNGGEAFKTKRSASSGTASKPPKQAKQQKVSKVNNATSGRRERSSSIISSSSSQASSRSTRSSSDSNQRSKTSQSSKTQAHQQQSRKRTNAYFIVERDLIAPPRRKTRPIDDGETIGDALFFGDDLMFGLVGADGLKRLKTPWPERLRERLVNDAGLRLVQSGLPGRTSLWDDARYAEDLAGDFCKPSDFNGMYQFGTLFSSHSPLWVIIALGTNDLKAHVREEALHYMSENAETFTFRQDLSPEELLELEEIEALERQQQGQFDDDDHATNNHDKDLVFDADTVAKSVGSIALKARRLFKGHCHEGTLKILVIVPPVLNLTPVTAKLGFDAESASISRNLPDAFNKMGREWGLRVISPKVYQNHNWGDGIYPTDKASQEVAELVWEAIAEELPRRTRRAPIMDH